jgi:mannitol/fructose-specific phosphotransferase system IIA component (Ntr-type)
VLIIAVGTVGKIAGVTLFYLPTGHGWREGLTIGAGMNGRGAVEIIVAQIGLSAGLISQELFSILVFMAIFTTATVPILLKWGTAWLERRGELVRSSKERIGYLIVGAGPTARALAQELARSHPVHLIDRNKENCARALAEGLRAIQGNALEEDVLNEAGATRIRACIVMTANAEVNAMIAQTARTVFFVPEISVIGSREGAGHDAMTHHLKAETLFGSPRDLVAWDYRLDNGQVRRNTVSIERPIVPPDLPLEGLASDACLPFVYEKGGVVFPFFSGSRLDLGDRLTLLQVNEASAAGRDRFDRIVAGAPVLDIAQRMELGAFFSFVAGVLAPRLAQPAERLADLFVQRERHHPSVLLPGLAIPHILVEHAPAFEVVVIRARIGVVFPGEAEPVHALFVLAGPPEERTFHLRALSAIAQIVQSPSFERDWFQARDSEALRQLILQAERQRFPVEPAGPGDGSGT